MWTSQVYGHHDKMASDLGIACSINKTLMYVATLCFIVVVVYRQDRGNNDSRRCR